MEKFKPKFEVKLIRIKIGDRRYLLYLLEDYTTTELIYMDPKGVVLYNDLKALLPDPLKRYHVCNLTKTMKYTIIGQFKKKGLI